MSGGKWRGPASVFVTEQGGRRLINCCPSGFGGWERRGISPPPTASRSGSEGCCGTAGWCSAAGWQPSQSGGVYEDMPWGFFALDLKSGEASPLTRRSTPTRCSTRTGSRGSRRRPTAPTWWWPSTTARAYRSAGSRRGRPAVGGRFAGGRGSPRTVTLSARRGVRGRGSETRGRDAPGKAWVIGREGKTVWTGDLRGTSRGSIS